MTPYFCKRCGKEFYPTYQHTYKKDGIYYCSWTCFNHRNDDKPKREIIVPKPGDVIRIKRVHGISSYTGREGVVEFIDPYGQLHGTWGGLVIVPEEDIFEIIGEQTND